MFSKRRAQRLAFLAFLVIPSLSASQVSTGTAIIHAGGGGGGLGSSGGFVGFAPGIGLGPGVVGKPFCAEVETTRNQVLADGNRIQNIGHERICRDSQGRVRMEIQPLIMNAPAANLPVPTMINITDPVANSRYTLMVEQHKAIKHEFRILNRAASRTVPPRPLPQTISPRSSNDISVEQLGTETISGLLAKGTRITRTIAAGTVGNQQPLTITSENWFSEDLSESLLNKSSDPRTGDMIREMKNITREEPDPSLFQVPSDYTIEEAPAPAVPVPRQ